MTIAEPTTRRFNRDEYHRMADLGFFRGQRVELIQGEIITKPPQNIPHALTCAIINGWLVRSLPETFTVRCQLPFVAADDTEPEPDFAVLPGSAESQRDHPSAALLAIEIADTSTAHDRRKADIYASRGIPEYWIINLNQRQLERFLQPIPNADSPFGQRYSVRTTLQYGDSIQPVVLPIPAILVSRLFPATL